jgi:endonuclease/exonuclease/phosphatase family metal-dependent hydrolase
MYRHKYLKIIMAGFLAIIPLDSAWGGSLKILTINVWSGLDYKGSFRVGDYEPGETKELRFRWLVSQIKELGPDIIFVQEANPVQRYSGNLAAELEMEEVHQVVNAGIKLGAVGIPANLREGLAILARPKLNIRKTGTWKLSGPAGKHSDLFSFHLDEVVLALAAEITLDKQEVLLVNVHLAAAPPIPADLQALSSYMLKERGMMSEAFDLAIKKWRHRLKRRQEEIKILLGRLEQAEGGAPRIIAGDFNAGPESPEIKLFRKMGGFTEVLKTETRLPVCTWDPKLNLNTAHTAREVDARGNTREGYELLTAMAGNACRKLDYIFLSSHFDTENVTESSLGINRDMNGLMASDHFGVFAEVTWE